MTFRTGEILNKLMGAGMVLASVGFFSDIGHTPEFILPGLLFGAGGFLLALRRERRVAGELELQQRVEALAEDLAATRSELGVAQDRLDRLSEERDFMRQLAPSAAARALTAPARASQPPDSPPV